MAFQREKLFCQGSVGLRTSEIIFNSISIQRPIPSIWLFWDTKFAHLEMTSWCFMEKQWKTCEMYRLTDWEGLVLQMPHQRTCFTLGEEEGSIVPCDRETALKIHYSCSHRVVSLVGQLEHAQKLVRPYSAWHVWVLKASLPLPPVPPRQTCTSTNKQRKGTEQNTLRDHWEILRANKSRVVQGGSFILPFFSINCRTEEFQTVWSRIRDLSLSPGCLLYSDSDSQHLAMLCQFLRRHSKVP